MTRADRRKVTVWCLAPEALALERARGVLVPDELGEWRSGVPSPRVAARWLLRSALSRELEVAPCDWVFDYLQTGRPFVSGPTGIEVPCFSLSHTPGMVVCATAWSERIGVDTERLRRRAAVLESEILFSESERLALDELEGEARARRRVELWTLKEAYGKAVGVGLGLAFDAIGFRFDGGSVTAEIAPSLPGADCTWRFGCYVLGDYAVSLALGRGGPDDPEVSVKRWFPTYSEVRA